MNEQEAFLLLQTGTKWLEEVYMISCEDICEHQDELHQQIHADTMGVGLNGLR